MHLLKLYRGDEAGALEYARRANAIQSRVHIGARAIGFIRDHELRAGRISAAMALYEKSYPELLRVGDPEIDPTNYRAAIDLALIFSIAKEPQNADRLLDRSLAQIQKMVRLGIFGFGIDDVRIYAIRGERQQALSALRQAIDAGWRSFWGYSLEHDLSLESLHDEPEFQAMVAEIKADMAVQQERLREKERNGEVELLVEDSATTQ